MLFLNFFLVTKNENITISTKLPLQLKIQKDTGWSDTQFHQVAWSSFYAAIRRIPWAHRISITKLAHSLWNMNVQNKKYYSQTDPCPICKKTAETTSHIYQCSHPSAIAIFQDILSAFQSTMSQSTPPELLTMITSGLRQWMSGHIPNSPTLGSKLHTLQQLNQAFDDHTDLGWDACVRGQISSEWAKAFQATFRPKKPLASNQLHKATNAWMKLFITKVWALSDKVWRYRNSVVHGQVEEFRISKTIQLLHQKVHDLYTQFSQDPFMLPASRTYLFDKPVDSVLLMDREAVSGWIRLVEEGLYTREARERIQHNNLQRTLHRFFGNSEHKTDSTVKKGHFLCTAPFSTDYYKRSTQSLPRKR
jgi:hypothetical protein